MHQRARARGDGADRDRGVDGRVADLHPADAAGARVRGGRRRHDLQGAAARHRGAAAVHGLPLQRGGSAARPVRARALRRADGRGADGAGLRALDVPRHRGPHLRRDRGRHQPARAGAAGAPTTAYDGRPAGRPSSALRVDRRHRRVARAGRVLRGVCGAAVVARRLAGRSTRSTRRHRGGPTTRARWSSDLDFAEFSHSALVRIADEVCLQMHLLFLGFRRAVVRAAARRRGARDLREAADRDRRGGGLAARTGALGLPATSTAPVGCCRCTRW